MDELAKLEEQIKERSNEHENESDTFDGRNPAPVDMVNILLFTGFYTSQVVVWDF